MQLTINKTQSGRFLYQDEAQEAINNLPPQGLEVIDSKWELVEYQNRVTMRLRNGKNEGIEISFLPGGSLKSTSENIKRALMNHPLITN